MNLIETTALLSADLPVAEFSDFMRLGSGFADDGVQDALLEAVLRAAIGTIETRISKVLIARGFLWQVYIWRRDSGAQALPVAPVNAISGLVAVDGDGVETTVDPALYRLEFDNQRPRLSGEFPEVPTNGSVKVAFEAGFGLWEDVPADLRQAVFLLAANYYENRNDMAARSSQMPFGVMALIEAYRNVRIGGAI